MPNEKDAIKHYLNDLGRWSPYKSERRRQELKEQREREEARKSRKSVNPLYSNRTVEKLYKDTVNMIYKSRPLEEA